MKSRNDNMYIIYLKSGNIVSVLGCSSNRYEKYTEIYKVDISGYKGVTARFENDGIEGFVVKEAQNDE